MEWTDVRKEEAKEAIRNMFYHGYSNYMKYSFPHDELKPLSASWTNSFIELGDLNFHQVRIDVWFFCFQIFTPTTD